MSERLTIPQVREALEAIAMKAEDATCDAIRALIPQLVRRPSARTARRTSTRMTETLRREIREWFVTHPQASYMQAGVAFNVSIGRVSEALRGKRDA